MSVDDTKGGLEERRFALRSLPDPISVYAGHLSGGRQALVGRAWDDELVIAVFDPEGVLKETHRARKPSSDVLEERGYEASEAEFHDFLKREFGFTPGEVSVKAFRIPDERFAVYHLPALYEQFLSDPHHPWFRDDDRRDLPGVINRWIESGYFVVEWGNDYWVNASGEVIAT